MADLSPPEPGKAEFDVVWGETVEVTCSDHRTWKASIFDLEDVLREWAAHYAKDHRPPEAS